MTSELKELIKKPAALKLGKAVILDRAFTYMMGSPTTSPMSLEQSLKKAGTDWNEVQEWLKDDSALRERWQSAMDSALEKAKMVARSNIMRGVSGELDLTDKELIDASFRFAEKTDKAFNPSVNIDSRNVNLDFSRSIDDIKADLSKYASIFND